MVTAATANGIRARVMADPLRLRLVDAAVLRILRLRLSPSAPEVDPGKPSNHVGEIPQGKLFRRGGRLWPPAFRGGDRPWPPDWRGWRYCLGCRNDPEPGGAAAPRSSPATLRSSSSSGQ